MERIRLSAQVPDAHYVFIDPPSLGALERRLSGGSPEQLAEAKAVMEYGKPEAKRFELNIVNEEPGSTQKSYPL